MTTGSVTSSSACFPSDSSSPRLPAGSGNTFSQELERSSSLPDPTGPRNGLFDRGGQRRPTNPVKPQKTDNGDQLATPATALAAPNASALPLSFSLDPNGPQAEAEPADGTPGRGGADVTATPAQPSIPPPMPPSVSDPQNTAFMMRMQLANAAGGGQQQGSNAGIAAVKQDSEPDSEDTAPLPQTLMQTQSAVTAVGHTGQAELIVGVKPAAGPSQTTELRAIRAEDPPQTPKQLNNILMQVSRPGDEKVVVRLVQQAGELRMAVRTDDSELAHGLQEGLTDLVGKLQGSGFRADSWHPVQAAPATGPTAESQNSSNHSRQGDGQSNSGGGQQDGNQEQRNRQNRPRWTEELDSSLTGGTLYPGEQHGITR